MEAEEEVLAVVVADVATSNWYLSLLKIPSLFINKGLRALVKRSSDRGTRLKFQWLHFEKWINLQVSVNKSPRAYHTQLKYKSDAIKFDMFTDFLFVEKYET